MRRSVLIMMYCILTLSSVIIEMILTRNIMAIIKIRSIQKHEKLTYKYHLIFTKLILLLDTFYYASFYLQRRINAIIQLRVVKFIVIAIWLIIACRLGFSAEFIISFVIQGFSLIVIHYASDTEYGSIYKKYNHRVSTDLNIINMYIVSEVIMALKSAIALFTIVLIMADFTSGRWNNYRILAYLKTLAFLIDRALQRSKLSFYAINTSSVIIFGLLNLYGIYYSITLFIAKEALNNEISIFIEILTLIMILLNLYYIYLYKKRKAQD